MLIGCLERFKHWFPLIVSGQFDGLVLTIWSCSQFVLEFVVILRRQVMFFCSFLSQVSNNVRPMLTVHGRVDVSAVRRGCKNSWCATSPSGHATIVIKFTYAPP